ncbi:hypothetical protein ACGFX4_15000 [Kitasatospora sp. NPDC048365]|uniref:hypothetical protein n=1 Tax=Kitasatospora sp. NPDC048365 TaxID=3364050 RepID=UPI00371319DA
MTVVAVTGHLDLRGETVRLVRDALLDLLAGHRADGLTGVSCLAPGADALFADAVLALGGRLEVVLPSPAYRTTAVTEDYAPEFDRLCDHAADVLVLPEPAPGPAAYVAANAELLRRADRLVAVWDGLPGAGPGGTADMVATARTAGLPVDRIWPPGASRG